MPGTRCTVAVCNNSFQKTKRAGMNIMYHQFPKTDPLRNIWIERCRRAGNWNPNSCHVCSIHFTINDYKQDLVSGILNISGRRRLKSTAVPSLFLTEPPPLELISLTQKKIIKSEDDKKYMCSYVCMDDDQTVCLQLDDANTQYEFTNNLTIYKSYEKKNSSQLNVTYEPQHENGDLDTHSESSDLQCIEDKQNIVEETNKQCLEPFKVSRYITLQDNFTQTNEDYFLENYKLLLHKNDRLKSELTKCNIKCKKLIASMNLLKSEIKRLKINSIETNKL